MMSSRKRHDFSLIELLVVVCPSDSELKAIPAASSAVWAPTSYGGNRSNYIADWPNDRPRLKANQVTLPSRSSYFMDRKDLWYAGFDPGYWNLTFAFRHHNAFNTLFVDGHTEPRRFAELPTDGSDPFWWWK